MISLDFEWQTNEFMLYCRMTKHKTQPNAIRDCFCCKTISKQDTGKWYASKIDKRSGY